MKKILFISTLLALLLISNKTFSQTSSPGLRQTPKSGSTFINQSRDKVTTQNIWINAIIGGITGVTLGIISSYIFWYWLYRKKPVISISSNIAQLLDNQNKPLLHNNNPVYLLKVVNFTNTEIIDIKLDLCVAEVIGQTNIIDRTGQNRTIPTIKLQNIQIGKDEPINELMMIDKFDKNDMEAKYAQQLVIAQKLESICNSQNSFLLFRIVATHATSGFSKVFEKRYDYPLKNTTSPEHSVIKLGRFQGGSSMDIK